MPIARKKHLRKKRLFLSKQITFILLNASNLKTSKIKRVKMSLRRGRIYFMPFYLTPPQIAIGCPTIMVTYDTLEYMQKNITNIIAQIDCLGVSIEKKWYPIKYLKKSKILGLEKKTLALLLLKLAQLKKMNLPLLTQKSGRRELNPQP
uniref:Orf129 n=1 Tax=Coccophora langsdorfii TaxID=74099 RepID=A0A1L2F1I1_9PHAE|nr:orf129 [Coccophora langsdorfii]ANS72189.1 orf129 [Coccophora langsdorfii]